MSSVKASTQGLELVDRARKRRHWEKCASIWCEEAQVSCTTLKRFWKKQEPIRQDNFEAICRAIGLDWRDVVDSRYLQSHNRNTATPIHYIPDKRCRKVIGRKALIENIINILSDPQELSMVSLCGPAGYGKTEVAREVAHGVLRRNLFANVLWVSARQTELVGDRISTPTDTDSLDAKQFFQQLATQLNCSCDRIPQKLREKKYLIVLDNAETAEYENILVQLTKILNPSRMLLTTRLKTTSSYVKLISIQGLNKKEFNVLLQSEVKYRNISILLNSQTAQLHKLHTLCCGAPLAVHFVVHCAVNNFSLNTIIWQLEQAKGAAKIFYAFGLDLTLYCLSKNAKNILIFLKEWKESFFLDELLISLNLEVQSVLNAVTELHHWYFIKLQQEEKEHSYYTLHPWVKNALQGHLIEPCHFSSQTPNHHFLNRLQDSQGCLIPTSYRKPIKDD